MSVGIFGTWVVVGLLTGWLVGLAMKDGGHGLGWDLVLGLIGSSVATAVLMLLSSPSETGNLATAAVAAFGGAATVIVAQRKMGPRHP